MLFFDSLILIHTRSCDIRVDRAGSRLKIKNQCHRTKEHLQRNKNTCDKKTFAFCLWQLVRSPPKRTKGTATNPRLIQVWSRARSAFRTLLCLHYCQIRAAERPFNRDEGEPRLLAWSLVASKALVGTEHTTGRRDTFSSVIGRLFGVIWKEKKTHLFHYQPTCGGQTFFSLVIMYLSCPCSDKHWLFVLHQFLCKLSHQCLQMAGVNLKIQPKNPGPVLRFWLKS